MAKALDNYYNFPNPAGTASIHLFVTYLEFIIPHACTRGKVIGSGIIVIIVVDIRIAKFGDLGT